MTSFTSFNEGAVLSAEDKTILPRWVEWGRVIRVRERERERERELLSDVVVWNFSLLREWWITLAVSAMLTPQTQRVPPACMGERRDRPSEETSLLAVVYAATVQCKSPIVPSVGSLWRWEESELWSLAHESLQERVLTCTVEERGEGRRGSIRIHTSVWIVDCT